VGREITMLRKKGKEWKFWVWMKDVEKIKEYTIFNVVDAIKTGKTDGNLRVSIENRCYKSYK